MQDQRDTGGTWNATWYGYDGHGSVRFLTNGAGQITDRYDYDAFGVLLAASGATYNRYRYCGEQLDDALGLYYLRARFMNAASGRFWCSDKYEGNNGVPSSLNKYIYADADPIDQIDPSGFTSAGEVQQTTAIRAEVTRSVIRTSVKGARKRVTKQLVCQFGAASFRLAVDGFHRHHPIPKNLGGAATQELICLPPETPRAFHQVLNLLLRSDPEFGGRGNWSSKAIWNDLPTGKPARKKLVLYNLRVAARYIDRKCGLKRPNSLSYALKQSAESW